MADSTAADFGEVIAARMRAEHVALAARWLERLRALVPVPAEEIFPTKHLLDHIPALIREIATYVESPDTEAIAANTSVVAKAQELGQLRHSQRASVHQLLGEYRLLAGILTSFVQDEFARLSPSPAAKDAIELQRRLSDALWILMQTTVDTFVTEYTGTIADHASRLENFNRMVSHELRQPLGTLMYAMPLLKVASRERDEQKQDHLLEVIDRNVRGVLELMNKLEVVSRLNSKAADTPDVQLVELSAIAGDVKRQLRDMADSRGVDIRTPENLPALVVDVARLELVLVNLVSNAIKYSDPGKTDRFVAVEAHDSPDEPLLSLVVRDNGLGIPKADLPDIFKQFVRAHAERDTELGNRGSGLGLAIVAECLDVIGGRIDIQSAVGEGTTVRIALPRRPLSRES